MWTTCPRCKGSGYDPEDLDEPCVLCSGDRGVFVGFDEDDPENLEDVDVQDED